MARDGDALLAGNGKVNPAGKIEVQSVDRTPQVLTVKAKKTARARSPSSGRLVAGGKGVSGISVTILAGKKSVGKAVTKAGGYLQQARHRIRDGEVLRLGRGGAAEDRHVSPSFAPAPCAGSSAARFTAKSTGGEGELGAAQVQTGGRPRRPPPGSIPRPFHRQRHERRDIDVQREKPRGGRMLVVVAPCGRHGCERAAAGRSDHHRGDRPRGDTDRELPGCTGRRRGRAAALNKKGGIKGQQIEVKFCNTNSNANSATACARQAVSDRATFVTGYLGTQSALIIPILQQANIPIIGSRSGGNPIDWTNPDNFPIAGGSASNYQALPFALKKLGKKRLFVSYQDVPSAATNAKNVIRAAKIAKIPIAGSMVLPGATTDFTPYVQKLRDANPDAVMFINSPGVSGGLMRAADALGVKPVWVHNAGSIGEPEAAQIGGSRSQRDADRHRPAELPRHAVSGDQALPRRHEGGRQGRRPGQPQGDRHLDLERRCRR